MDFENIFYVILAVIYFLSRVLKARKQEPPKDAGETGEAEPKRKTVTFEDLLKEFGVEEEPAKQQEVESIEEVDEVEEDRFDERRMPQSRRYSDAESKSIYEQSIRDAEGISSTDIDQSSKSKLAFKEFAPYQEVEEVNEVASEIRDMLQSDDGGKKAIILSEIINRRY